MSCGEKVSHYSRVEEKRVPEEMASKTYIRWLIAEPEGAKNFYMRLFRMESGGHIKAHFHPWEHEIFVVRGRGRVRIGSRTYNVEEGTFLYIPPNVEHEYWSEDELWFICVIPSKPTAEKVEEPLKC
ncbi:MAG: cupin domain-containing protein [Desulfurococcales archaeon]|nr:cupin domain-containing protein [Desulfurococcales archaeon]